MRKRIKRPLGSLLALALLYSDEAGCPFDFVFFPSRFQIRPEQAPGEVIEFHLGRAGRFEGIGQQELVDKILDWTFKLFPELDCEGAVLQVSLNDVKTFAASPTRHLEHTPGVETPVDGLFLCGDWIRYDSPVAYMEKAFVTGMEASAQMLHQEGLPKPEVREAPAPRGFQLNAKWVSEKIPEPISNSARSRTR